ncbi:alpha/beta fold hydrolase [Kribbella sp. NPDC004875]|uniref:alpha/beta fold hydrolase n=1 Tax=Kribbella sp. NPDC004875 TaxID=3364107 RepID=UPI003688231F
MELRIPVGTDEVWADHLAGGGVPIVLLHPESGDSQVWDPVLPGLSGRRVLRYDARGSGRSSRASGEFSPLGDLETVLSQLDLQRVLLVGCSAGGGTALSFALVHPEQVHGLVLLYPDVPGFPRPESTGEDGFDDDVYDQLHEIRVPSVVVVGDEDSPVRSAMAGATAARIPGCEFIWTPGADPLRHADTVTDAVRRLAGDYDAG